MVPFATDPRFEDDTLFIIFEEDYRFAPERGDAAWSHGDRSDTSDKMPSNEFCQYTISSSSSSAFRKVSPPPPERGASSSTDPARGEKRSSTSEDHRPTHPEWESRRTKHATPDFVVHKRAKRSDFETVSVYLRDLVATANLAAREGIGEFIFAGWQPHGAGEDGKTDRYRSGAHLVMVTKTGFKTLEIAFVYDDGLKKPGHIDLKLKKLLVQAGAQKSELRDSAHWRLHSALVGLRASVRRNTPTLHLDGTIRLPRHATLA